MPVSTWRFTTAFRSLAMARKTGATAATVSADSNVFTTAVNVAPFKRIRFELTYEEVLSRAHAVYKHVINVQPNLPVSLSSASSSDLL